MNKLSTKTKKSLLDTSAMIALLKKEPGYEILEEVIARSAMSAVNLSELVAVLSRNHIKEDEIDEIINDIVPEVIPFSEEIATQTGKLIKHTRDLGLSLGDRACIASGIFHNMTIYTTDKAWIKLKKLADIVIIR